MDVVHRYDDNNFDVLSSARASLVKERHDPDYAETSVRRALAQASMDAGTAVPDPDPGNSEEMVRDFLSVRILEIDEASHGRAVETSNDPYTEGESAPGLTL